MEEPAEEQTGTDSETALLPKSIFGQKDLHVGAECKVRIEHVYDDEVEVSYVPHEGDDKEPSAADEADSDIERAAGGPEDLT